MIRPAQTDPTATVPWETVDPDILTTLSEEITSLSARVSAETCRLLQLIAEFDRLEGWKREGFASCAEWLAYSTHLDKMTAREKVRVARAIVRLPETSSAMASGALSFSQVRALTRVADAESESELLGYAREMSAAALERLVRSWRRPGPKEEAVAEAKRHAGRCLSLFPDEDGSYLIRGRLDPEVVRSSCVRSRRRAMPSIGEACPVPHPSSAAPTRSVSSPSGLSRPASGTPRAGRRRSGTSSCYTSRPTPAAPRPLRFSPLSRTAPAFPRKRPEGSRATRA
jgi:hypothetical protein